MRSQLFDGNLEGASQDAFALQNPRLLKVTLDGEVLARQGSMVAYQGEVAFDYEGAGGVGRFLKKALSGEGLPLMRCRGRGEVFLAQHADEVHLVRLEGDGLTVNAGNILAFEPGLEQEVRRIEGAGMFSGGIFNTELSGTGWVAITATGTPVVLRTDQPTYADTQSVVAWSSNLRTSLQRSAKKGALIGRGSGEAYQLAFHGDGFVVVQASEGPWIPPHSHGSGG